MEGRIANGWRDLACAVLEQARRDLWTKAHRDGALRFICPRAWGVDWFAFWCDVAGLDPDMVRPRFEREAEEAGRHLAGEGNRPDRWRPLRAAP